ncbi:MAG: YgcG family protein [Betaproteobacteria bacterium]|nr:YgcG family protein [Betaproteobacteria bacterium]
MRIPVRLRVSGILWGLVGMLLALLLSAFASTVQAQPASTASTDGLAPIPKLTARVTDLTGTLSPADTQALETKLADWEQRTGNQLVVVMVPSTAPEPIESYSIRLADAWKIGHKGKDNGAIFLIAKNDRKMRIEVGYGLEGVLTDVTSHRIIAETVAPMFRQGKFVQGIDAGVDRIIEVVGSGAPLPLQRARAPSSNGFDFQTLLILLFVVVPVIGSVLSRIFGRTLGSAVGGGVIGLGAWVLAGSLAIAFGAGVVALLVMLLMGAGGGIGRGGGMWIPTGGWGGGGFGGGGFGGGGGFSGGGGGFGGGGSSGSW